MSSQVTVELEGEPMKRAVIKTTPAMSLKSIMDAAVEKLKLPANIVNADGISVPQSFTLKDAKKNNLDLTLSVRFANLPAGAKLTLVKTKSPSNALSNSTSSTPPSTSATSPSNVPLTSTSTSSTVTMNTNNAGPLVTIALQVEDGSRLIQKFPISTTLWEVLTTLEKANSPLNLTRKSGVPPLDKPGMPKALKAIAELARKNQEVYMFPVILLMNKEFNTLDALQNTSLKDAGIVSGNAMLRLLYRYTETSLKDMVPLLERAVVRVANVGNGQQGNSNGVGNAPVVAQPQSQSQSPPQSLPKQQQQQQQLQNVPPLSIPVNEQQPTPMEIDNVVHKREGSVVNNNTTDTSDNNTVSMKSTPTTITANENNHNDNNEHEHEGELEAAARVSGDGPVSRQVQRNLKVFLPPPDNEPAVNIERPDSFFELTPAELKLVISAQSAKAKMAGDAPLKTKAMREREEMEKMRRFPRTCIRVRFPDRWTLQAEFLSGETVSSIYKCVQESLPTHLQDRQFILYMSPPLKQFTDRTVTLWNAGLTPSTMLYFKWAKEVEEDHTGGGGGGGAKYLSVDRVAIAERFPVAGAAVDAAAVAAVENGGGGQSAGSVAIGGSSGSGTGDSGFMMDVEEDSSSAARKVGKFGDGGVGGSGGGGSVEKKLPKWFKIGEL
ncbi:Tether containing UBX domain for GLUT4 [Blyttiomyces sp. JEL0837]|nr:Tether containing UBX domain for GLUT4 [Blyttiomyces sp. JEL0837]